MTESVATDSQGNILLAGLYRRPHANFSDSWSPDWLRFSLRNTGGLTIFVAKYTSVGEFQNATFFDVSSESIPKQVLFSALTSRLIYLAKYSPNGEYLWAEKISDGATFGLSLSIHMDSKGNPHIVGSFDSRSLQIYDIEDQDTPRKTLSGNPVGSCFIDKNVIGSCTRIQSAFTTAQHAR